MRKPLPLHPLTLCVLASLAASAGVHAQTKEEGSDRKVSDLATVSVSASRIDRPDLVAPTPTLPITAEELKLDTRTNIGAALNDLPQFRATSSPQTTGSNTGARFSHS